MDLNDEGRTHFAVLGVEPDASTETIRAAYRRAARRAHPDTGGSVEEFGAVQAAWEVLSDPGRRAAYQAALDGDDWGDDADFAAPFTSAPHVAAQRRPPGGVPGRDPSTRRRVDPLTSVARPVPPRPEWRTAMPAADAAKITRGIVWSCRLVPVLIVAMVVMREGHPLPLGTGAIAGFAAYAFVCVAAAEVRAAAALRGLPVRFCAAILLCGSVAFYALMGLFFVAVGSHGSLAGRAVVASLFLVAGVAGGVWAEVFAARVRAARRARYAADDYGLAAQWNALLGERAALVARGRPCAVVPRRTDQPHAVTWELLDDGRVVASASDAALDAWTRLVSARGRVVDRPVVV